jgi:hypothetical protein
MSNGFLLYPSPGTRSAHVPVPTAGARRLVEKILFVIFLSNYQAGSITIATSADDFFHAHWYLLAIFFMQSKNTHCTLINMEEDIVKIHMAICWQSFYAVPRWVTQ